MSVTEQRNILPPRKTRQGSSVANIILADFHSKNDYEDRSWNLAYLEQRFRAKELEELYIRYEQRSLIGTFTTYLVLQSLLSIGYIIWTAVECQDDPICREMGVPEQLPDTVGQSTLLAICIMMILVVYNESIFKAKPWLLGICSFIIAITLEAIDVGLVLYHGTTCQNTPDAGTSSRFFARNEGTAKVPIVSLYNHLIIYLFLPITRKDVALMFGAATSFTCIGLFLGIELTCRGLDNGILVKQLIADLVFYASLNFIGFYVRYVGEINMRRGFLDKRGCIDATFKLKYEKEQEENLLLSIIPKHIASQVRNAMWKCLEQNDNNSRKPFHELFIERHENVSMLFADICKFTELTTRLPVDKLVKTLNDLFGKFDVSAERHNCMRIKILGDCYYCVSGVPVPDPRHAHNCVEMGLDMIDLISDVRREHGVEVDMRIGIHTGYILSGVIGLRKWQYDIWSKDVTIANAMEAAGTAGAVHVTSQTKSYLGDSYKLQRCPASDNAVLTKNGIQTFLIYPEAKHVHQPIDEENEQRQGGVAFEEDGEGRRPHSLVLDNSVQTYQDMLKNAESFMRDEIEKLPLRKFDQWLRPDEIKPIFLLFRDKSWEKPYLMEYDPLFKFYILATFIVVNAMGIILLLTEQHPHIPLWIEYTILFVLLVVLLPCLWVSYVWDQIIDPHYESDSVQQPENRLLKVFYNASKLINTNMWARHIIFILIVVLVVSSAILDVTSAKCPAEDPKNYTYRCALALMVIFLYLRIHHLLKCFLAIACLALYACFILGVMANTGEFNIFSKSYFGYNEILPEDYKFYSHFVYLAVCAIFLFFMDRQHEYMNRLDYQWKRQLKSEQEQARLTKLINKTLLQNILPQHIASYYLTNQREEGDLYSEVYTHVAVLFASIPDYMDSFRERDIMKGDYDCLRTLNEIMNSFDKLLFDKEFESNPIEKIKVISSTYMAACGLLPGRNSSLETPASAFNEPFTRGDSARTMTKFAAAMMRTLAALKAKTEPKMPDFQLRIGVNVGRVIAGVVGAQKPLYDIWGDTVNVASRMDYFGMPGKIQVTQETAECLMRESLSCSYRDIIDVKGKGKMTTYFVDLTPDFEVVQLEREDCRFDSQQSLVEDDPEDRPITLELSRFYVSPTDLTSKDNKDDSISVDKTSTTSVETKQPLSAKNSFDTESVSTVSTIDYQSRVITVAEIHRHVDNVDNKYLDENYNERRYEMDAEMSSEMSEDGTTETMSDDDDHQRSINSMASSLNSETYSAEIRAAIGQMDGILDSQRDSEGYSEDDEKVPSRKVSKQSSEETPSRKISRLELNVKKDSGYGSQGLIAVDQIQFKRGSKASSISSSPEPLDDVKVFTKGADDLNEYYTFLQCEETT